MRQLWTTQRTGLPTPVEGGFVAKRRLSGSSDDELWLLDSQLRPLVRLASCAELGGPLLHVIVSPARDRVACSSLIAGSEFIRWQTVDVRARMILPGCAEHPGRPVAAVWAGDAASLIYSAAPDDGQPGLYRWSTADLRNGVDELVEGCTSSDGLDELHFDTRHRALIYARKLRANEYRRDLVVRSYLLDREAGMGGPDAAGTGTSLVMQGTDLKFIGSTEGGPCFISHRAGFEIAVLSVPWITRGDWRLQTVWRDPSPQAIAAACAFSSGAAVVAGSGREWSVRLLRLRDQTERSICLKPDVNVTNIEMWSEEDVLALTTSSFYRRDRYALLPRQESELAQLRIPGDPLASDGAIRSHVLRLTAEDGTELSAVVCGRQLGSTNPMARRRVILLSYGGFGVPTRPEFRFFWRLWLRSGGVIVAAEVRGGGAKGSLWHASATGSDKPKTFQDLRDITRGLIDLGVCSKDGPVLFGQSNGGLTAAGTFLRWPDMFAGLILENSLLDMLNYADLNDDHAWIYEFGLPSDDHARRALREYSPVEMIKEGAVYPPVLLIVNTADETVNPLHSYRFVNRLGQRSPQTRVHLLEVPGSHGLGVPVKQLCHERAVILTFADRVQAGISGNAV